MRRYVMYNVGTANFFYTDVISKRISVHAAAKLLELERLNYESAVVIPSVCVCGCQEMKGRVQVAKVPVCDAYFEKKKAEAKGNGV